ncbi:hypothetical protein ACNFBR_27275 [Pseudomonas sp. NY11955]|uniref:hypothetical protein n=1 Tax=Pseudomonas sp. NY11955 TaxID=3400363 RepID=UPI003A852DD8
MLPSLVPAFVRAVDRGRREIRVEIPPYTDGANEWPIAEMCYPIGDDSPNTEIRVVVNMPVWVAFRGGDERYPIIMGHRPVNVGNEVGTRRWNHDNFELNADKDYTLNSGISINLDSGKTVAIDAGQTVTITAGTQILLQVGASTITITPAQIAQIAALISLN